MRLIVYKLLLSLIFPFYLPLLWLNNRLKGRSANWWLGDWQSKFEPGTTWLWVYTPSAGEVLIAQTFLKELSAAYPEQQYLIIAGTHSGFQMASRVFGDRAAVVYLPLDFGMMIRRLLANYPPAGQLIIESEFRPNLIGALGKLGVGQALVNGKITERTAARYRKIGFFLREVLAYLQLFCMQTPADAAAIIGLGAAPDRVDVVGNAKFDQEFKPLAGAEKERLSELLGLTPQTRLLVAGSTHAGEEAIVIESFQAIATVYPETVLLIAPRNLERVAEVGSLLEQAGVAYQRRSQLPLDIVRARVVLLDTMGELTAFYGLADLAFVGGSLVAVGGHNIIEPAAMGCPVLFGDQLQNFTAARDLLVENGVGFTVRDGSELTACCLELLGDPERRSQVGEAAQRLIATNRGAAVKTIKRLKATGIVVGGGHDNS